jgi:hypothetical protein
MRTAAFLVAALGLVGCGFHAAFDGTHYQCGLGDSCPVGYACIAGSCEPPSDSGPPADAAFDADPTAPDAAPATVGCGSLDLLIDDFAAATASPLWSPFHDAQTTVAQTGGALRITLAAGSGDLWAGYESQYAYDLTGAQVATTVDQVGGKDTVLEVRILSGARAQIVVENGMIAAAVFGVPGASTRAQIAYQPAVHRHWRIRESSGQLYWETSPDGASWTALWSEALPFEVAHVRARLTAGGLVAAATEARFADVNVGAPPAPGLCAAASLVDDFTALGPRWAAWADPGCTVSIVNGALVLASSAGSENYCGIDSEHLYDLTASAIYADAGMIASGTSHVSFFQAIAPGDGNTRIEIDRDGANLQFQQWVNSVLTTDATFPYTTADRYWRLKIAGGVVNLGTSPDAITFTEHTNATLGFDASAVHIVVAAGHYAAASTAVNAKFGGVNTP